MGVYPLNEFAKANCHLIQSEDTFTNNVSQQLMDNNLHFAWTSRMIEFMMPMWKMRSNVEDLRKVLHNLFYDVRDQIANLSLIYRWARDPKITSKSAAEWRKIKEIILRIESVFQVFSSTKLPMLKKYARKILRMVSRVREEKRSYIFQQANQFKIMDPELSPQIVQEFLAYGLETAHHAYEVMIQYKELHNIFLTTEIRLWKYLETQAAQATENAASGIQPDKQPATCKQPASKQPSSSKQPVNFQPAACKRPETQHPVYQLPANQEPATSNQEPANKQVVKKQPATKQRANKQPAKQRLRKWINNLCIVAVLTVPWTSCFIPNK